MSKPDLEQLVGKNQSIKIVPSIEDSLCALGLNVNLDDNTLFWYQQLKTTWKTWKKTATLENHVELFFEHVLDPFRVGLVFVIKSEDVKDCKQKTLPYFIIETLQKWSIGSGKTPDDSLKLPAFHVAIQQRSNNFLNLLIKTYHVPTIKGIIIPVVKDMIKNDNCKLASQVVIAMDLSEDIPVEELLFPLILQDKTNIIDEYLTECPSQVHKLLQYLDNLLDKRINLREFAQKYIVENKICHVKYEKIHYKPLGKLVARLCNKFNIPIESCKNLSKNRTTGGLRYLIHQKYQEHNVSSSVWDDLVKDSLRQNAGSAQEFIDMLMDYDKNEARKWADYLNIPTDNLPLALREMTINEEPVEENWDTVENSTLEYYKLSLPEEHVVLIDTGEKFYDLMTLLSQCSLVSIDCEWKPSFGAKQSQVALIQVATYTHIYLIDALLLNSQSYSSFWYTFYKTFLDNAEIIKLGFGLEQDLKEMKASVISLGNIKVKGEGLLDLSTLWRNLLNSGLSVPNCDEQTGNSLSNLVQSCFGLPLEKSEQCSNWELRPLRKTQILYAALDAYVLVEVYRYLQNLCVEQGINFEEICNVAMQEPKKKSLKKVKVYEKTSPFMPSIHSRTTNEVKVLIEPKISHLMAYLRYCGIDTTVFPETMLWCDVVNLATSEERYILLTKHRGTPDVNFPQSSIINVGKGIVVDQLQIVFNSLNVGIKQSDLFKFCIKCNDKELTKLSPNEVQAICKEYQASRANYSSYPNNHRSDYDDDIDELDNFLSDSDCDEDLYKVVNVIKPNNISYKTKKGALIQIENVNSPSNKPGLLCESCGTLFRDSDELSKSVSDTILSITKLSFW
ncbi:exonuclease mut-7 homolog [Ostrinia furnacalis]|uniref:exonuclease mut-7 homolog n=1 Tax=Ostrinia furnacalis TaxID=93504 RepID=UPI00103BDC5F|nr:exonuclease mut-7 homolog [Ostrinia furnacalis]